MDAGEIEALALGARNAARVRGNRRLAEEGARSNSAERLATVGAVDRESLNHAPNVYLGYLGVNGKVRFILRPIPQSLDGADSAGPFNESPHKTGVFHGSGLRVVPIAMMPFA